MTDDGSITKQTYEDPEIVEGYIRRSARVLKQKQYIQVFLQADTRQAGSGFRLWPRA